MKPDLIHLDGGGPEGKGKFNEIPTYTQIYMHIYIYMYMYIYIYLKKGFLRNTHVLICVAFFPARCTCLVLHWLFFFRRRPHCPSLGLGWVWALVECWSAILSPHSAISTHFLSHVSWVTSNMGRPKLGQPACTGKQYFGCQVNDMELSSCKIPSGKLTYLWEITIFNGKIYYKICTCPFSIAIFWHHQRVLRRWGQA